MVKNTSEKGKSFKPQSVENNIELALNLMKTLVTGQCWNAFVSAVVIFAYRPVLFLNSVLLSILFHC